jgi:dihydrofolate reductase
MLISLIVAMDRHGLIGDEAGLPWRLPRDLRRFRTQTWGKPIVMGRRTFELIGKPLPGRLNIVLTHNPEYWVAGCRTARDLSEALSIAERYLADTGGQEAMIIGGGKVYQDALPRCDRLYLTLVEGQFAGTTYFPVRELLALCWRPAGPPEVHPADENNPHPHSFHILERVRDARAPLPNGKALDLSALLAQGPAG